MAETQRALHMNENFLREFSRPENLKPLYGSTNLISARNEHCLPNRGQVGGVPHELEYRFCVENAAAVSA